MSSSTKPFESQFPFLWSSSATETSRTVWSACSLVTPDCSLTYLMTCPWSRQAGSGWQPDGWRPTRCPAAPAPWLPARVVPPDLRNSRLLGTYMWTCFGLGRQSHQDTFPLSPHKSFPRRFPENNLVHFKARFVKFAGFARCNKTREKT